MIQRNKKERQRSMTKKEAIEIIKSECYIFNPLNFDRSTMVNTALKALEKQDS